MVCIDQGFPPSYRRPMWKSFYGWCWALASMGNNFGPQCVRLGSAHQLRAECTWPIHFSNANHISDDVYHLFHCRICAHIRIDVRKLKFMNARQSLNQPAAPVRISLLYAIRLLPCCQSIFSENFDRQNLISNQLKEITQFYEVHAVIKSTNVVVVVVVIVIPVCVFFFWTSYFGFDDFPPKCEHKWLCLCMCGGLCSFMWAGRIVLNSFFFSILLRWNLLLFRRS